MANDGMTIELEGQSYELDDFELGELEWLEDELGGLSEDKLTSMKATVRFVYLIKHRDNPEFTLDDARKIKVRRVLGESGSNSDSNGTGNGNGNGSDPTKSSVAKSSTAKPSKARSSTPVASGATS